MRARRASGGREGELVRSATKLRQSVDPLLPKLSDDCPPERFDKLRAALEKVREHRDDKARLDKVSRWEDDLVRAYAGLLSFYLEPELPGVLVAPFPGGEVSFAPLGAAPKESQIAVQQFADPKRLMIGYLSWARKGYHFFATADGLYCTGPSAKPPASFLRSQLEDLPYRLEPPREGRVECVHLAHHEPIPWVGVNWPGAERSFRVCRECAKSDRQLLASISRGVAVPDPEKAFPVEVSLNVDCRGGPTCVHHDVPELPRTLRKSYLFGRLSDAELIDQYRAEVRPVLERSRTPVFVAGGVCFGNHLAQFLDALHPTPEERKALEETLPEVSGLFEVDEPAASRVLERLWPDHAETIVRAIVPDPQEAERLVREAKASPGRVSELLRRAARATHEGTLLRELPRYSSLVPEAAFVDAVARAFRSQGAKAAEKQLLQSLPREGKQRGIGFGLLIALDQERPHAWQFTDTDRQFGQSLAPLAKRTLEGPSPEYHDALAALLGAAGVTQWGVREP
ncbi:MAG: hypothetical protein L3K19_08710 [Thermoplasmata archaeon]|nr:hypothetical protein [Thermoplasmata archaeon]